MLTLHYTITKDDYINYYIHVYNDEPELKKRILINTLKNSGVSLFYAILIGLAFGIRSIDKNIIPFLILLFFTTILPFFTRRNSLINEAKSFVDKDENENIFIENTLIASDADFQIKTKFCEVKYFWNAITKKSENKDYYFLYVSDSHAIIIPLRAFKNNEEKSTFDKILSRNLSLEAELNDFK
jgi:YcxB-like protein